MITNILLLDVRDHAQHTDTVVDGVGETLTNITAPVLFGAMHVMPAINRFLQRYDRIKCNVRLLGRVVNLHEEGIDAGIRIGELGDSTLVAQQLGGIRRRLCENNL